MCNAGAVVIWRLSPLRFSERIMEQATLTTKSKRPLSDKQRAALAKRAAFLRSPEGRAHQRAARRQVKRESLQRAGRRGYEATLEKHGAEFLFENWRAWKLAHPSTPELRMIGILATLKIPYEREWRVGDSHHTVDFKLTGRDLAIEVYSRVHTEFQPEQRAQWKARKMALLTEIGISVLWIKDEEMSDVAAVIERVRKFCGIAANGGGSVSRHLF